MGQRRTPTPSCFMPSRLPQSQYVGACPERLHLARLHTVRDLTPPFIEGTGFSQLGSSVILNGLLSAHGLRTRTWPWVAHISRCTRRNHPGRGSVSGTPWGMGLAHISDVRSFDFAGLRGRTRTIRASHHELCRREPRPKPKTIRAGAKTNSAKTSAITSASGSPRSKP